MTTDEAIAHCRGPLQEWADGMVEFTKDDEERYHNQWEEHAEALRLVMKAFRHTPLDELVYSDASIAAVEAWRGLEVSQNTVK